MMKTYKSVLTSLAIVIFITLTGCASQPTEHYSGFLNDYVQLKPCKDAKGGPIMVWVSPDLTSGKYHTVIIDPVVFYPAAAPTKDVDAATLSQIQAYYTDELRQKIGA